MSQLYQICSHYIPPLIIFILALIICSFLTWLFTWVYHKKATVKSIRATMNAFAAGLFFIIGFFLAFLEPSITVLFAPLIICIIGLIINSRGYFSDFKTPMKILYVVMFILIITILIIFSLILVDSANKYDCRGVSSSDCLRAGGVCENDCKDTGWYETDYVINTAIECVRPDDVCCVRVLK